MALALTPDPDESGTQGQSDYTATNESAYQVTETGLYGDAGGSDDAAALASEAPLTAGLSPTLVVFVLVAAVVLFRGGS